MNKYLVPNMGDFTGQIEGCSVFSKLDLKNSYLQVSLHGSVVPNTTVGSKNFCARPLASKMQGCPSSG